MTETWVAVPDYEGLYEVSDDGRVRSCTRSHVTANRWGTMVRKVGGRVLSQQVDKDGYLYVKLHREARAKHTRVGRLVLTAFVGAKPGCEACHDDHDRQHNALSNLKWGTRSENEDQKTRAGRRPAFTRRVITPDRLDEALRRVASGDTQVNIARDFGCHVSTVNLAVRGKTWSNK